MSRLILQRTVAKFVPTGLVAEDGLTARALDQREDAAIDVVISGWMMLGGDGVALCRTGTREHTRPVA